MKFKEGHKVALILLSLVLFVIWIESEQRIMVKGRVVEAGTGKPIEGASVAIKWSGTHIIEALTGYASGSYTIEEASAITDKDGYFEVPKYFLKSFEMGVYKKGYVCWSSDSIFTKGIDIKELRDQIKKRFFFWVRPYMKIKLEPFTGEYPRFRHAGFIIAVSSASGGLYGTGEEEKFYYDIYWNRKSEK